MGKVATAQQSTNALTSFPVIFRFFCLNRAMNAPTNGVEHTNYTPNRNFAQVKLIKWKKIGLFVHKPSYTIVSEIQGGTYTR